MQRSEYGIFDSLPLVTDFPSRKHWEAAVWQMLVERLLALPPEGAMLILQSLLSSSERTDITYRALAASRIRTHISLREIGRELWLTRQTVSAVKKSLRDGEYKSSHARGHKPKEYTPFGQGRKEFKSKPATFMGAVRQEQRDSVRAKKFRMQKK